MYDLLKNQLQSIHLNKLNPLNTLNKHLNPPIFIHIDLHQQIPINLGKHNQNRNHKKHNKNNNHNSWPSKSYCQNCY